MTKTVITIEGRRDAYSADDLIGRTMNVGELISILEQYDEDTPVMLDNDNGYTYGAIHSYTIDEKNIEVEDDE